MLVRGRAFDFTFDRFHAGLMCVFSLAFLFIPHRRGSGFFRISVGQFASGNWIPADLFVPLSFRIQPKTSVRPSMVIIWLFRWLLFRLVFESGIVKLFSGDINWAHLTALTYHYWTQPLPNMISWYANQLPLWFQELTCVLMFVIEIFIPFLIFCGRWGRLIAFFGITGLQLLIILTGNYCFFNLLAIALCLTLLEDEHY